MKLSILIPTIKDRTEMLNRLLEVLKPQIVEGVELIIDKDDGEVPIGEKRNRMMQKATGEYVCFIDDDDMIPPYYVAKILNAIELNPDCVGFWLIRYVNGVESGMACHSLRYRKYATVESDTRLTMYERTPNHLNPIKRSIAIQVPFPTTNHGEDTDFAKRVYPMLESEVFVDSEMYRYLYVDMDKRKETTNDTRTFITPEEWFNIQGAKQ